MSKNEYKIPEHIRHIYKVALKYKVPLTKAMYNGNHVHKYNQNIQAAILINFYIISEK